MSSKTQSNGRVFRRVPECPNNFVHFPNDGKCYFWMVGSWNWSAARRECNNIDSHPLVVDDSLEISIVKKFISMSSGNSTKCLDKYKLSWTAGVMIQPNVSPFVWKPFKAMNGHDMPLPITYEQWAPGQPDNYGSTEFCLHLRLTTEYNDLTCDSTMCVICEIDV